MKSLASFFSEHYLTKVTSLRFDNTKYVLTIVIGFIAISAIAQERTIQGKVQDNNEMPLPAVNITVVGTSKGTSTDFDGNFEIEVEKGQELKFSSIGFEEQIIIIEDDTNIAVIMQEGDALDEVVVVGYGSTRKEDLTSAVSSIKPNEFISGATSPLMAIQGKVPGLTIESSNGADPNAGTSIQLRGINSVNSSQGPLIVIDGVPGGSLSSVIKEDVESIDVLRDASAAAIYGTRASGGVILITTKQAKKGKLSVSYTGELFMESVYRYGKPLSTEKFLSEEIGPDLGHDTNWFDEVTNSHPLTYRNVISLSGGGENAQIRATVTNQDAEGLGIGSSKAETKMRVNTSFQLFDNFIEISNNLSYGIIESDYGNNDAFRMALELNPTETPYDPNSPTGLNVWTGGFDLYNPVADIKLQKDQRKYRNFLNNTTLIVNLLDNLKLTGRYSYQDQNDYGRYWRSSQHKTSLDEGVDGYASQDYNETIDQTLEAFVNYNGKISNHSFDFLAGYSFQEFNSQGFNANNSDFPVDGVEDHDLGSGRFLSEGRAGLGSYKNPRERIIAFFGRLNYNWKNKYLLTASLRREGSSKFASGNKWGSFPAISLGWNLTQEHFMKDQEFFNHLKLRAGYGETGNEGFAPGSSTRMYSPDEWWLINSEWRKTYGLSHNQNPDLHWETKKEYDIGIDFSILNNKITGSFSVYQKDIDDLIYDISVAQPPAIHDKTTMNVGTLRSSGWDAELTWNVIEKEGFRYSTTLTGSSFKTKLLNLADNQTYWDRKGFPAPGSPGNAVRLYPGRPIGQFYVWEHAGFTDEGNWMLYDKNGEAFDVTERSKSNSDKKFIGNAIPKLTLSWSNQFQIGNFDINAYFRSWIGHDVFNMTNMYYGVGLDGQERNLLDRYYEKQKHITGEKELSDYWIEKGDFIKLDRLTIGYTFNMKNHDLIENLRIHLTGRNLFVLTEYSGINPEVNINGLDPGFEWYNIYPDTRTFMTGVEITF